MILIVDGDQAESSRLERVLKYNDFSAVAVSSGMEALALVEMQPPALIVLEMELQDMNGMLLLRAIREDPRFAELPILVFTRTFADEVRQEALRNGAQDFLVKGTVGWSGLIEKIRARHPKPPS
jgi:chemosensory pili system protein ChpA (sensor histidine kinase/response regulator)